MLTKIISGGQTGADRAALDAGLTAGFPTGGSCPVGRMAEDGPIDHRYHLLEIGGGYRQRTRKNVADADGTAIFYESYLQVGTEATVAFCIKQAKPYKLIDIALVPPTVGVDLLMDFVQQFNISILNVAGPRASGCPAIYDYVNQVIGQVIHRSTAE